MNKEQVENSAVNVTLNMQSSFRFATQRGDAEVYALQLDITPSSTLIEVRSTET